MKESRWDIAPKPNFQKDLAYGKLGEDQTTQFLKGIVNDSFEVKSDRYRNGRMVVEVQQNPRDTGWKASGLTVTKASWWVYVYALNEGMVIVDVKRLKRYIKTLPKSRIQVFAKSSSNPTRGFLLEPEEVMTLLYSSEYDA